MLAPKPGDRPTISQVFEELRHEELLALGMSAVAPTVRRLRINTDPAGAEPGAATPSPAPRPASGGSAGSRVRININPKKES
jgi:hypothetical protein